MGRLLRYVVVALFISLLSPVVASAHVLQSDGSIGAVLHINPDDNPQAAVVTQYILAFNDSTGKFSLPACDCQATVIENGKTINGSPLGITSAEQSNDTFTFPRPDVYILQVTGKPKTPGGFQPFKLDYTVRVEGGQQAAGQFPPLLGVGLAMMVGLVVLFAYASDYDTKDKIPKGKT